jgi:intracellular multiplication protein IcmP
MSGGSEVRRDDMGLVYLSLIPVLAGLVALIWYLDHTLISYNGLKWVWLQLQVFDLPFRPSWAGSIRAEAAALAANASTVTFAQLVTVMNKAGYFFVWIPILFAVQGFRKAVQHPANKTRRRITAATLPWIMSKHSPAVIPTLYYGDLLNEDPEEHRSSINPEEWVKKHGLLVNGRLDRGRARELLVADLGDPISSISELKPHERALFAVFGSRLFSNGKDLAKAQQLLDDLNRSCHKGTFQGMRGYPDLSIADKLFAKYSKHPEVVDWLSRHPYPRSLLHSMHKVATGSGKLPSSHFRWLKGMDRALWYALNTTGRKAPFQESSAVFTQAMWEEYAADIGYRLTEPFVDDAIDGLEKYLVKIGLVAPINIEA